MPITTTPNNTPTSVIIASTMQQPDPRSRAGFDRITAENHRKGEKPYDRTNKGSQSTICMHLSDLHPRYISGRSGQRQRTPGMTQHDTCSSGRQQHRCRFRSPIRSTRNQHGETGHREQERNSRHHKSGNGRSRQYLLQQINVQSQHRQHIPDHPHGEQHGRDSLPGPRFARNGVPE